MSILFRCPGCNAKLRTPEDKAGTIVPCPRCKAEMVVPLDLPTATPDDSVFDFATGPTMPTNDPFAFIQPEPIRGNRRTRGKAKTESWSAVRLFWIVGGTLICLPILTIFLFHGPRQGQERSLSTGITYYSDLPDALDYARHRKAGVRRKETSEPLIPAGATLVVVEAYPSEGLAKVMIVGASPDADQERFVAVLRIQHRGLWIYWPDTY